MSRLSHTVCSVLACIFLASACTVDTAQDLDQASWVYQQPDGPVASTYGVSCAVRPLVLDPSWTELEREEIRAAVGAWETIAHVDLGELPVAEEPCTQDGALVVSHCVALSDTTRGNRTDSRVRGIVVWGPMLTDAPGYELPRVIAHEVGHWLGIGDHAPTPTAIMRTHGPLPGAVTDYDAGMLRDACE